MDPDGRVINILNPSRRKCELRNEGDDLSFLAADLRHLVLWRE